MTAGNDCKVVFYNDTSGNKVQMFDYSSDDKIKDFTVAKINPNNDCVAIGNFNKFFVYYFNSRKQQWEEVYNKHLSDVADIPAVISGAASIEDARNWLECVSKVHPENLVSTCIKQTKGFGAREIRALSAYDNKEYYPALSA
ncbi:MAG: hypothetical protein GY861_06215, partial [bacterium]|nr:hypothetical protein [bacterium]